MTAVRQRQRDSALRGLRQSRTKKGIHAKEKLIMAMVNAGNKVTLRVFVTVLTGLALNCTADKSPSKMETAVANMAKDLAIPMEAEKRTNPLPVSEQEVQQG